MGKTVAYALLAVMAAGALGQATAPAKLLSMPDSAGQARAKNLIHTLYKTEYAKSGAADRDGLAKTLLAQAPSTTDDPANRFELYMESADLAAQAGDADTITAALDGMGKLYEINIVALKTKALITAYGACPPDKEDRVADAALLAANQAAAADDFTAVQQLANLAEAAANKTKRVAVVAALQPKLADLRALAAEYDKTRVALDTLKTHPDDKDAHLAVGTFYALHKGNWELGLPHLARGTDTELAAMAARELAMPSDPAKQVEIADAWWNLADSSPGPYKWILTAHADAWYRKARAGITGLTLTRIDARLQTQSISTPTPVPPGNPVTAPLGNPAKPGVPAAADVVPGANVDLLTLVDTTKDVISGTWKRSAAELTVANDRYALLQLPYAPPEEYDLTVTFTRTAGDGSLAFLLSSHKKSFGFALDVKGEARFERVANKIAKDNPTTVPVEIVNGKAYTVKIEVRRDHIAASLDGKALTSWKTDYKDLARYALWKMTDDNLCGLGANNAVVSFSSVVLTPASGAGKATR